MEMYDTLELIGMFEALDHQPRQFFYRRYFPTVITFETEEIMFDKISSSRRIAPYVHPMVQGRAQAVPGWQTNTFKPAYVKPKAVVTPNMAIKRRPGERVGGGEQSLQQKLNRVIAQILEDHDDQVARREEYMAIEVMRTGKLTVESPEFPKMVVDFGRPNGHTEALTLGDRWGETGVEPLEDLLEWGNMVQAASGVFPTDVVFDPLAAGLFLKNAKLKEIMDNRRQRSGDFELIGTMSGNDAVYIGSIGQFNFYQYQQVYTDDAGANQKMIPDYSVFMSNPQGFEGFATYGAILDVNAMQAMQRFPKMWEQNDPSAVVLMTQAAPLPVTARPEASFYATVR